MAVVDDLINQIEDVNLRERIQAEVNKLTKQKKFGLVFENHVPECTPLYELPIHKGTKVSLKGKQIKEVYVVIDIHENMATCLQTQTKKSIEFSLDELVAIAEFGEAIYPYLKSIDSICNAPESDLWHTLIEADNYHALQLLEYLYAGKVDCIYIDPPYNTRAKDWKYNNDYVDPSDAYRHSKWLSMMEKRLKLAKKLLNPKDSVLIVTIDEKEHIHLGCLLEELFPEARMQMVSSVINPAAVARDKEFGRTDEYLFFIYLGDSGPSKLPLNMEWNGIVRTTVKDKLHWNSLIRTGTDTLRSDSPNLFYPIFIKKFDEKVIIHSIGEPYFGDDKSSIETPKNCVAVWPIRSDGKEGRWQVSHQKLDNLLSKGYVKIKTWRAEKTTIYYLKRGEQQKVEKGLFPIIGHNSDGSIIVDVNAYVPNFVPGTAWQISPHDASRHGSNLLRKLLGSNIFSFPKSLYAVHDTIRFFVANKPNALILDFFAGSGTTLHAINLLNAEDGGRRRCIMVTNNEVSNDEAKKLTKAGFKPGDPEWEKLGIAHYVTWPRTICSIKGEDVNGRSLKGNYGCQIESYLEIDGIVSNPNNGEKIRGKVYKKVKKAAYPELEKINMADGFKANAHFFKLGFLNKTAVQLGRQFRELLPVLWMKTGCSGPCPVLETEKLPAMLLLPENHFAVLIDEHAFAEFRERVNANDAIRQVFLITDSQTGYKEMLLHLDVDKCYQLYRDYLDNFRINTGR